MASQYEVPAYDEDVDFAELALQDADFAKVLNANKGRVDFKDPKALQQLTKSLLRKDFNLTLDLPDDRLCPPVPVRYNYIRWIQDLIDTTSDSYTDSYDPSRQVIGIDIGVGASCIYPLLGCASRPQWRFGGTDIDSKNLSYARRNIVQNKLHSRIRLLEFNPNGPLIPLDALGIQRADFTMCNPPFYASKEDMMAAYSTKEAPPSAVCTGAEVEMITEGGDAGFVLRMVEEGRRLGERVQWYTSMLGKLQSVNVVVARLKEVGVGNWAVACLRAGNKTRRWAVAWSFEDMRPRNDVARRDMTIKDILPFPTEFACSVEGKDAASLAEIINQTMSALDLRWRWKANLMAGVGFARENVWSRSARRKKKRQEVTGSPEDRSMDVDEDDGEVALGVKISVKPNMVEVRWLQGKDSVLFESFCGMIKRAVT